MLDFEDDEPPVDTEGTVVVHLTKLTPKGTLASQEIARFIAGALGVPLLDTNPMSMTGFQQPHTMIMVNSPTAFCDWREELAGLWMDAGRRIFVQNDYVLAPPSQVARAHEARGGKGRPPMEVWGTVPHKGTRYINWNALGWPDGGVVRRERGGYSQPGIGGLVYWGAARPGRREQLSRYLSVVASTVSCSPVAGKWFKEHTGAEVVKPFAPGLLHHLSDFGATLYIEDEYSHEHFTSPATRFYEALAAGLAIFFDRAAVPTMAMAGYDVRPYVVRDGLDVARLLERSHIIADEQAKLWRRHYRDELGAAVWDAFSNPQASPDSLVGGTAAWPTTDGPGTAAEAWRRFKREPIPK